MAYLFAILFPNNKFRELIFITNITLAGDANNCLWRPNCRIRERYKLVFCRKKRRKMVP